MANISSITSLSLSGVKTWEICRYEYVHVSNLSRSSNCNPCGSWSTWCYL